MSDTKIRLAIAGVGNCASSLLQGIEFYEDADPSERVPGLMHVELGGYHIRDIELVLRRDAAPERGETGPEHVGDEDDVGCLADGALDRRRFAALAGRSHELRMGVAHLVLGQALLVELRHQGLTRQPIVHGAGLGHRHPSDGVGPEHLGWEVSGAACGRRISAVALLATVRQLAELDISIR